MLKNYFTIALRNLRRQRGYAFINVAGLAVGIACCLLIARYLQHELSFDRYHENADRIYRLVSEVGISESHTGFARAGAPLAALLRSTFPEVEQAVRLVPASHAVVRVEAQRFDEHQFYFADSTLFDIFTLPLLTGNPKTALAAPYSVVLTRSTAARYFGEQDPIGQVIQIDGDDYQVTGVMVDVPAASHFHFDLVASLSTRQQSTRTDSEAWVSNISYATYLLLRPGASAEALTEKLQPLLEANVGDILRNFDATFVLNLQPLTSIHLHSKLDAELEPTSDILYIYLFATVAVFIVLIACINFMNLATARSMDRAKEVGVRKVMGAGRQQLIRQFLSEAILIALLALVLAIALASTALPAFNELIGRSLQLWSSGILLFLAGLVLLVGLGAGGYPAFYLSTFRPAEVLKGTFRTGTKGAAFRKVLVVLQFTISIVLLIGTFVVQRQLHYAQTEQLGFSREQVIVLPINRDPQLFQQQQAFKQEILHDPNVVSAALTDHYPGGPADDWVMVPEGRSDKEGIHFWAYRADFDLLRTLGMEVTNGRSFNPEQPTDSSALLINETAARMLDWTDVRDRGLVELEGPGTDERVTKPVIGVVRDFHFESFRHTIRPLLIRPDRNLDYLLVRVQAGRFEETLSALETTWRAFTTETPFTYSFLDDEFEALYQADRKVNRAFSYLTGLAIFIACLGLFGLATFAAEQRTKEIGIRKVLGATVFGLVAHLSKDFLKLVLISFVIACPLAYLAMSRWLENFAYRIDLGVGTFLLAGVLAVAIALLTVSYQAIRSALANPVHALRNE